MKKKLASIVLVSAMLTACVSVIELPSEARPTPPERIKYVSGDIKDAATVTFLKGADYTSAITTFSGCLIKANDFEIGEIKNGERMTIKLPAGEYVFKTALSMLQRSGSYDTFDQRLEPNKSYYYQIFVCAARREFFKGE